MDEISNEQLLQDLADEIDALVLAHRVEVEAWERKGDIHTPTARIVGHTDNIVELMAIIEERLWRLEDLSR